MRFPFKAPLMRIGNSHGVVIPSAAVKSYNLIQGTEVALELIVEDPSSSSAPPINNGPKEAVQNG